jgi:hypothetical protein
MGVNDARFIAMEQRLFITSGTVKARKSAKSA